MTTHQYAYVFTVHADPETGKRTLDSFLQIDAQQMEQDELRHLGICGMEDKYTPFVPKEASALYGIRMRAAMAGNVAGPYCVKTDENLTRNSLWAIVKKMPAKWLRETRLIGA